MVLLATRDRRRAPPSKVTMIDKAPTGYFDRPVRLRLGEAVGRIVSVAEALDWIHGEWPDVKVRFRRAEAMLEHAAETRVAGDTAAARQAFVAALLSESLLAD
jgi:hypothetical protein